MHNRSYTFQFFVTYFLPRVNILLFNVYTSHVISAIPRFLSLLQSCLQHLVHFSSIFLSLEVSLTNSSVTLLLPFQISKNSFLITIFFNLFLFATPFILLRYFISIPYILVLGRFIFISYTFSILTATFLSSHQNTKYNANI